AIRPSQPCHRRRWRRRDGWFARGQNCSCRFARAAKAPRNGHILRGGSKGTICHRRIISGGVQREQMRRFFFNFRKGDEISADRRGMWLPNEISARKEARHLLGTLLAIAGVSGDRLEECEYQIANDNGEIVATVPLAYARVYREG